MVVSHRRSSCGETRSNPMRWRTRLVAVASGKFQRIGSAILAFERPRKGTQTDESTTGGRGPGIRKSCPWALAVDSLIVNIADKTDGVAVVPPDRVVAAISRFLLTAGSTTSDGDPMT